MWKGNLQINVSVLLKRLQDFTSQPKTRLKREFKGIFHINSLLSVKKRIIFSMK